MKERKRLGLALCGSYCTYEKVLKEAEKLAADWDITAVMSETAACTDSRFGKAEDFIARLEELTGKPVMRTITAAERVGPERLFDVPPECFMPRPKVTSSVVRLTPRTAPLCPVRDEALMFRCVKAAFAQRRKTLSNALGNGLGSLKPLVLPALERAGIDPRARGETLSCADFARLSDALSGLLTEN